MTRIATAPNTIPAISPAGTEDLRCGRDDDVDCPAGVVEEEDVGPDVDPSVADSEDVPVVVVVDVEVVLLLGCDIVDVLDRD